LSFYSSEFERYNQQVVISCGEVFFFFSGHYKLASEASVKAQIKQKEGYDLRTRGAIIESGDRVLVRIVAKYGDWFVELWRVQLYA
jgi:hypothetical protein